MSLELELMQNREMGWPFNKNKVGVEEPTNSSRREFMGTVTKGGIALAGSTVPFLASASNYGDPWLGIPEGYDLTKLPPGISSCRDAMIMAIWAELDGWKSIPDPDRAYTLANRLLREIGIQGKQISFHSLYLEPATYMLKEKMGVGWGKPKIAPKNLKLENPSLFFFNEGISKYFEVWVKEKSSWNADKKNIEINFVNSIFVAAYQSLKDALIKSKAFFDEPQLEKKAVLIKYVMKQLENMTGANKKSVDPKNAYNRRLVAAWSSFFLTTHLDLTYSNTTSPQGGIIYDNLEVPLRKLSPRIRGPPYYTTNIKGL